MLSIILPFLRSAGGNNETRDNVAIQSGPYRGRGEFYQERVTGLTRLFAKRWTADIYPTDWETHWPRTTPVATG
jgi:hypothetical protein